MLMPVSPISLVRSVVATTRHELMTYCKNVNKSINVTDIATDIATDIVTNVTQSLEMTRASEKVRSSNLMRLLKALVVILVTCFTLITTAQAQPQKPTTKATAKPAKIHTVSANELSSIRVTKYELALVQVMAEICPDMLSGRQKSQFYEAYSNQLRAFIPSVDDPERVLGYLSTQQDYRAILQSMRSWTKRFPQTENRELCVDFANVSRAF